MAKTSRFYIRLIYDILLSISVIAVGTCLIAGCLVIYFGGGEQPYSREIVVQTLLKIAIPLIVCAALTVGGFVWDFFDPACQKKNKTAPDIAALLPRLYQKKALSLADECTVRALKKEQVTRRIHTWIRTGLTAVGAAIFTVYSMQPTHFDDSDINGSVVRAVLVACACFAVPCCYAIYTAFAVAKSYVREMELLKAVPTAPIPAPLARDSSYSIETLVLRIAFFAIALLFLLYGLFAGGTADVLTKAVNICTECIGLG